jgi:hypothetical protein
MWYYVCNHQHKGRPYHLALHAAGHHPKASKAEVALFDRDWFMHNDKKPRFQVTEQLERGSVIMIYPHSALPPWWYDGLIKIHPYVACVFVIGEGQKAAMRIIEPSVHVETTGWPWCPQKQFEKPEGLNRVLFGPIHPAGGRLRPEAFTANREIFHDLKRIQSQTGCEVVVRYIGSLKQQGLHPYHRFEWIKGRPDGQTKEIDAADVVIAEGTFIYQAVARGKPTVGINQHLPCRANKMSDKYCPHNWDKYGNDLAYPINYEPRKLLENIEEAMQGEQSEWRKRFIGDQMDRMAFAETVEGIWRESKMK